MCAVVLLLFIGDEFVTARNGHIDATTERVSFLMSMIGLLDGDIAAVDVVAEFFEPRRVIQNEIVDLVRFFQTPISDLNRQLHSWLDKRLTFDAAARDKKTLRARTA